MNEALSLPPLYTDRPVEPGADVAVAARQAAAAGSGAGTLVYAVRPDLCECAVVLEPEQPLGEALQVAYLTMLAVNDALGSTLPAQIGVGFGWPDRILVNGALAGGITLASETDDIDQIPAWMVAYFAIDVMGDPSRPDPGQVKHRTSLMDEGSGPISVGTLIESFARYFLSWITRWQDQGFGPAKAEWEGRAEGRGSAIDLTVPGGRIAGDWVGLNEAGGLIVQSGKARTVAPISWILDGPSWRLGAQS